MPSLKLNNMRQFADPKDSPVFTGIKEHTVDEVYIIVTQCDEIKYESNKTSTF